MTFPQFWSTATQPLNNPAAAAKKTLYRAGLGCLLCAAVGTVISNNPKLFIPLALLGLSLIVATKHDITPANTIPLLKTIGLTIMTIATTTGITTEELQAFAPPFIIGAAIFFRASQDQITAKPEPASTTPKNK